jgi:hypothetical protein
MYINIYRSYAQESPYFTKEAMVDENIPRDTRPPLNNQPADGPDYYDWQEYVAQENQSNVPDRDNHPTLSLMKTADESYFTPLDTDHVFTAQHRSSYNPLAFTGNGDSLLNASLVESSKESPSIVATLLSYVRNPTYTR